MYKILVIEDNLDNYDVVESYLEDKFEIYHALDGFSGFELIQCHLPDLVLLDISLPDMDGIEVLKKIKQEKSLKNIPIIALTAHAMVGDRDKFLSYGFDEYISKPIIDDEVFIEMIESLIERKRV